MRIAVIGWGSLIWDPRDLQIEDEWYTDGPMLPVEFARVSSRNRLTLVLSGGAPLREALWAIGRKTTLAEAVTNLAKREGTKDSNIGRWPCTGIVGIFEKRMASIVAAWAQERRLDAAVWTALGPKKPSGENGLATDDELIIPSLFGEAWGSSSCERVYRGSINPDQDALTNAHSAGVRVV